MQAADFSGATPLLGNILITFPSLSSVAIDNVAPEENYLPKVNLSDRSDY